MITIFRQCTIEDLDILQPFSRQRYFETFADRNTPENMTAYLDEAFAPEKSGQSCPIQMPPFTFCTGTVSWLGI